MTKSRALWCWLGIGLLSGCQPADSIEQFGGPTMGSTYSVKYVRTSAVADPTKLQGATREILEQMDQQLSTYRNDSVVAEFNRMPAGQCMVVPAMLRSLVEAGEHLSQQSEGAFDLTVAPLLQIWGFGPNAAKQQVPSKAQIAEVLPRVGHQHVRIEGERLCKNAPVELDFNSIAAGHAVDLVGQRLKALGVQSYLVEITGELKAEGVKPDGSAWRIGIEAPRDDQQVAQKIIDLDGLGVSTSGDYRNYYMHDGQRYSHTLDPATGQPILHRLAAVTVVAPSARDADGLSTLLMVLGPERGMSFAQAHKIAAFFVLHAEQGFEVHSSAAFDHLFAKEVK